MMQMARRSGAATSVPAGPDGNVAGQMIRTAGTGTDWVRGSFFFAPGAYDDTNLRVLISGSEPAGGIYVLPLEYYHANGDRRACAFEFQHTFADASAVAISFDTTGPRLVTDLGSPHDAVEFCSVVDSRTPCIAAITDSAYLAEARALPFPTLPYASLTTRQQYLWDDGWNYFINNMASTGSAEYDSAWPYFVRWAIKDDNIADLVSALKRITSNNGGGQPEVYEDFTYKTGNPATDYTSTGGIELNPSNYAGTGPQASDWTSGGQMGSLMWYATTGAYYGRLYNVVIACGTSDSFVSDTMGGATPATNGDQRSAWRRSFGCAAALFLTRESRTVQQGSAGYLYAGWGAAYKTKTIGERLDLQRTLHFVPELTSITRPSWLPAGASWGMSRFNGTAELIANAGNPGWGFAERTGDGTMALDGLGVGYDAPAGLGSGTAGIATAWWVVACTSTTSGGLWSVTDPHGSSRAQATTGVAYSDGIAFTITAGATPFVVGDKFVVLLGKNAIFQWNTTFTTTLLMWLNGGVSDTAWLTHLDAVADYIDSCLLTTLTATDAHPLWGDAYAFTNRPFYGLPYNIYDPSLKSYNEAYQRSPVFALTVQIVWAWIYARSGHTDTDARDKYDSIADINCIGYGAIKPDNTLGTQSPQWKEFGEYWQLMNYAQRLRNGYAYNSWGV